MLLLMDLVLLALATWPALNLLSMPHVRREYSRIAWSFAGLLLLYAGVVGGLAVFAPSTLQPLAALAAVGLLAERWRARAGYGASRGLPPGSLSLFPRGPWVDHRFYLKAAERFGPIFKSSLMYRPGVCVLGASLGSELLRVHADSLEAPRVRFNRFIPKGFLRYMEPEDHPYYKQIFRGVFASGVMKRTQPVLREIAEAGLLRLVRASAENPGAGIAPQSALREIVFDLLVWCFFGLRPETEEFTRLRASYEDLDLRKISLLPERRDREALAEIEAWVRDRGLRMREALAGGGDAPPCFLGAMAQAHPEALVDETVLGNLVYTLTVGRADLTALLTWCLKQLGEVPDWAGRLRQAARKGTAHAAQALAWSIVRETLRLEQSEYVYRRAKRDIHFQGFLIPRNWRVRVLIREGHRNPEHFPDPERFDPGRWLGSEKPSPHYQPFGLDAHACVGGPVTEALSCLFLTELARACDWQVVSDGPREYGWAHWQPSAKFRLVVTPAPGVETTAAGGV